MTESTDHTDRTDSTDPARVADVADVTDPADVHDRGLDHGRGQRGPDFVLASGTAHGSPAPSSTPSRVAFTPAYADQLDLPSALIRPGTVGPLSEPSTTDPAATGTGSVRSGLRRWGGAVALVTVGLVGGVGLNGVVANASAGPSAPAGTTTTARDRGTEPGGDSLAPGVQGDRDGSRLAGPDGSGPGEAGQRPERAQLSGGSGTQRSAPSTQGSTGASG